jgi:hypothetical protein
MAMMAIPYFPKLFASYFKGAFVSQSQLSKDYERDGCVRAKSFLNPTEVKQVRQQLDHYMKAILPNVPASDRVFEADGKSVRNLWRLEAHDPFFKSLSERANILETVAPLVHGNPVLIGVETFNKPAKVGSGVPHHQDNAYFCQSPPDVLTIWIAIDAATLENGPIYYVKGSHKGGMLPHRASGVKGNSMVIVAPPDPNPSNEFCGTLEPGDALIHQCQTIHFSTRNNSDSPRCGLLMVYRGAHTTDDPKLKEAYRNAVGG